MKTDHNFPVCRHGVHISVQNIKELPFHWHRGVELIYVLKGNITAEIHKDPEALVVEHLGPDDIHAFGNEEIHRLSSAEDNSVLFLYIEYDTVRRVFADVDTLEFDLISDIQTEDELENVTKLKRKTLELASGIMDDDMQNSVFADKADVFIEWLINAFEIISKKLHREKRAIIYYDRMIQITNYIQANFSSSNVLSEISARFYLNPDYISQELKKKIDYSFQQLLNFYRVSNAIKLLLDSDFNISEISAECGFSATRYMYKEFRKFYPEGPSQFRKVFRGMSPDVEILDIRDELSRSATAAVSPSAASTSGTAASAPVTVIRNSSEVTGAEPETLDLPILYAYAGELADGTAMQDIIKLKFDIGLGSVVIYRRHEDQVYDSLIPDCINQLHAAGISTSFISGDIPPAEKKSFLSDSAYAASRLLSGISLGNSVSPIHIREAISPDDPAVFSDRNGLMTFNGILKPVFHAVHFLIMMGGHITGRSKHHMITEYGGSIRILVFNHIIGPEDMTDQTGPDTFHATAGNSTQDLSIRLDIRLPHDLIKLTSFTLDSSRISCRDLWEKMGRPAAVSPADILLMNKGSGPAVAMDIVTGPRWQYTFTLTPYSIRLICLEPLEDAEW